MKFGYLRSDSAMPDLHDEIRALERVGCDRIFVESGGYRGRSGTLKNAVDQLNAGDCLVVWELRSIAGSVSELVIFLLDLERRKARFRALAEAFDTGGEDGATISRILAKLGEFQARLELNQNPSLTAQGRRVGRPRALSLDDVARARDLLKSGAQIDQVARQLHISRATLYRYLDPPPRKGA